MNGYGDGTKMSSQTRRVPFAESQHHVIDPANPGGALDDGVKNRLHVRRRAADDAEYLGCRRLMLERLPQFRVACFEFSAAAQVLNRASVQAAQSLEQS